jgi:hypothetical protein
MDSRFRTSAVVFIAILAVAGADAGSRETAAVAAANEWLALVDAGKFETSWERSASLFRKSVSADQWTKSISTVRTPFGKFISRELLSANYMTSLPGAPDGQYVMIQYRCKFENKQAAVETVTPMFDDGEWKVSGYYVK